MAYDFSRATTVGVEDMVMLPTITDKAIVENLKTRFAKDLIYTNIGSVLISVNPFKRLPMYTPDKIDYYRAHGTKGNVAPHIFALAEDTYRTMIIEEENQCVIISGESGAGKTEASKQIMQYVAAVSGNSTEMQRVKEIILDSNPLLEAFGNAKTVRNDNSSRFGKFFEIYFDRVGGPIGGKMSNFLLEKSRVTRQQNGERNFHIFYQLCCGADASLRAKLKLKEPGEFFYLNQGKTLERAGVDDAAEFDETLQAMKGIGFPQDVIDSIFSLLAAILHLGEVSFDPVPGKEAEFKVRSKDELVFVAGLLGCDAEGFERALTWKKLDMVGETVNVPLDLQQCTNTRDAVAKMIYDKIFDYTVEMVNKAFGTKKYDLMLGVLDIYGFEIFKKNGFEQFCINYVNEKLQQIFIELTLRVEQEEYVREKIAWEEIKFFNNKIVCDLIEGTNPPGLFSIIDDVCAAMAKEKEAVADVKMCEKLGGIHGGHPHFRSSEGGFMVKHYAGEVHYSAQGFTSRNKDLLSADIMAVTTASTNKFLSTLLATVESDASSGRGKKRQTAATKIRQQAAHLVKTLMNCTPHYVRTVKSNDEKQPNLIDDARVVHQAKYLGLLENIRVRRAGFAYRQYFDKFLRRFKFCCPQTFPRPFRGTDKNACKAVLEHVASVLPATAWQLGETKVFVRQPQHLHLLEEQREAAFGQVVCKIQRAWTRYSNRREYVVLKRNLGKIYAKAGKQRRSDSVFRPYLGDYLNYRQNLTFLHSLVDFDMVGSAWQEQFSDDGRRFYYNSITQRTTWEKPAELAPQHVIYTDKVERVFGHDQGQKRPEYFIMTDRGLYFIEQQEHTVVTPPTKPTKQNPHPAPPPAPYNVTKYVLQKKLDLRCVSGISVSLHADTYLVIHMYQPRVPYRHVELVPAKGTPLCQLTGHKFKNSDKKLNCYCCGCLALATAFTVSRPLPTLGHVKPVPVCPNCVEAEPWEAVEDVVLSTSQKTEVVAMLRRNYRRVMGSKIPVTCADQLPYQLFGEAQPRTAVFQPGAEDMLYVAPKQLVIHCTPGITQEKIAKIEADRDARAKAALERHKQEREADKDKEKQKEKEREEAHRVMVAERKKAKEEAAEKAEQDRLDADRAARDKKLQSQQKINAMRR